MTFVICFYISEVLHKQNTEITKYMIGWSSGAADSALAFHQCDLGIDSRCSV